MRLWAAGSFPAWALKVTVCAWMIVNLIKTKNISLKYSGLVRQSTPGLTGQSTPGQDWALRRPFQHVNRPPAQLSEYIQDGNCIFGK